MQYKYGPQKCEQISVKLESYRTDPEQLNLQKLEGRRERRDNDLSIEYYAELGNHTPKCTVEDHNYSRWPLRTTIQNKMQKTTANKNAQANQYMEEIDK